jgi:DNA polymerase-3 subunit delta
MLAACYLVHGGEPLQTEEIIVAIKQIAAKHDYNNNMVFEVNAQFNWEELLNKCQNLDLFAEKSLVELRLQSDNIGKQGATALESLLEKQSPDICILIRAQKLKPQVLNSTWVNQIQKHGKIQVAKPIPANKWLAWVQQRLRQAGFTPSTDASEYIARFYEGNLTAAAQCIQKLQSMLPKGALDLEQIRPFLDHNSHFSVFELAEAIINGECERTFNIFHGLKNEGVDPVLILWALAREIRNLLQLKYDLQSGINLTQSAQRLGIWRDRIPGIQKALDRLSVVKLEKTLKLSATIDSTIKGITPGNAWELLLSVCMMLTSSETLTMEDLTI